MVQLVAAQKYQSKFILFILKTKQFTITLLIVICFRHVLPKMKYKCAFLLVWFAAHHKREIKMQF